MSDLTPIRNEFTNAVLGQPQGWDEERDGRCSGLPVHASEDMPVFASWWKLTWRQRLAILFGAQIRLFVHGQGHPPVMLSVVEKGR